MSGGNIKGVARQPLAAEIMSATQGPSQPFQQKPGIELWLCREEL